MTTPDLAGMCERLRERIAYDKKHYPPVDPLFTEAAAAIESLVAALRQIDGMCPATCETSVAHDMAQIARTALGGASDDR